MNPPHLTFRGLRTAVGRDSRVNRDAQSFVQDVLQCCYTQQYTGNQKEKEMKEKKITFILVGKHTHTRRLHTTGAQSVRKGKEGRKKGPVDRSFTREQQS